MDRIPVYIDIENLAEIFSLDRDSDIFYGMKKLLSVESILTFLDYENDLISHPLYPHISKELVKSNYITKCLDKTEHYLHHPFKTNLQHHIPNKSSIVFSNDTDRVNSCVESNGILLGGIGHEQIIYNRLNYFRETYKAFRILPMDDRFNGYKDLEPYILPFTELIINEPYLFVPEKRDYNLDKYLDHNFKPLMRSLLKGVKNKINISILVFENIENEKDPSKFSPWYDHTTKSYEKLYDYINDFLRKEIGGARFKLWLVVSPYLRKARHDRFILTNYQFINANAGLTFFDDHGSFINRGEAIEMYSIMDDNYRKELLPSVLKNLQEKVVNNVKTTHAMRIFGITNGDSFFLKYT